MKLMNDVTIRCVFILLIIGLASYFIYINVNIREHFDDPNNFLDHQSKYASKINDIFYNLFLKSPSKDELDFYMKYVNSSLNDQQLSDFIATTGSALDKALPQTQIVLYGTEDDVIKLYNQMLYRNPNSDELKGYAEIFKTDSSFTLDKLSKILISSEEYRRFEKMQTNEANGNLLGGITEHQLTLTVDNLYTQYTGQQADSDTLKFLKRKFVDFKLNEDLLSIFIKGCVNGTPYIFQQESNQEAILKESNQNLSNQEAILKESNQNLLNQEALLKESNQNLSNQETLLKESNQYLINQEAPAILQESNHYLINQEATPQEAWFIINLLEFKPFVQHPNHEIINYLMHRR